MLKRRKKNGDGTDEMVGQDSFLDIVSNIVGILIILVMVAGIRAQNAPELPVEATPTPMVQVREETKASEPEQAVEPERPRYVDEETSKELEAKYRNLAERERETFELQESLEDVLEKTETLAGQMALQQMENAELLEFLTASRTKIDILAEEKDKETREKIELQRRIGEADAKLEEIDRTGKWIEANRPKATVMENIPTPISKTVEEKEAHFRLLGGKIVYVPIMELFEKMSQEVATNKNRLFKQKSSTGAVGPIENWTMEYMMVTYDVAMRDSYGSGVGTRLELEYAEILPLFDELGRPLREAIGTSNSEFLSRLKLYRQDIYTITVWVYPDSFEEFRELKQFLYKHGYRVAARPMEFGDPISGSPRGTKSSSQ